MSHTQCNDSPGRVVFWAPAAELTELKLAAQRWVAEQFIIVFFLFDVVLNFFLGYSQLWSPLTGLEIRTTRNSLTFKKIFSTYFDKIDDELSTFANIFQSLQNLKVDCLHLVKPCKQEYLFPAFVPNLTTIWTH